MIKLFTTAFRPVIIQQRCFQRQFQYNFAKISKKDQERMDKKQEKQNLGLSKTIDFTIYQTKFDQYAQKFQEALKKLQVGKLTPEMLDRVSIQAYGEKLPLSSLAQASQKSQGVLILNVFDESTIMDVMKALENSDLNLQVKKQDKQIVCQLAQGNTKESRIIAVNNLKKLMEDAKQNLRQIRHECIDDLKPYKKVTSEDTMRQAEKQIQDLFEKQTQSLDSLYKSKEKELLNN
ncbi:unnamed protein product [Paramecium pentaurelia]|uniref:Ribosome recycling factor domain-containing protein n=1 Tax=Paramecium pentaurelia TaxID=43138 RepID=A0A8S1UFV4_9CILI|nr:unnamed protein product [Paramecium pentaurelia]